MLVMTERVALANYALRKRNPICDNFDRNTLTTYQQHL